VVELYISSPLYPSPPFLSLSIPSHSFPPLRIRSIPSPSLPSLLLEVGPLNAARDLGERCKLPSGVWGVTPAEIEFGAFKP